MKEKDNKPSTESMQSLTINDIQILQTRLQNASICCQIEDIPPLPRNSFALRLNAKNNSSCSSDWRS